MSLTTAELRFVLCDYERHVASDEARRLHARVAPWFACVERARASMRVADKTEYVRTVVYEALKGWASVLVGNDAPAQWYIPGGYDVMIEHLTRRLEL